MWHRVVACPLYIFSIFINDLLIEVEKAGLGVQLNNGKSIGGLLFADDFVGMSDSSENLPKLIDVVHKFCNRWRLKANVSKCAVVVISYSKVPGSWIWGEHTIPQASSYCYLGVRRHRGRNGRTECVLCGDECENVVHVLWECSAYKDSREEFLAKLRAILGEVFKDIKALGGLLSCLVVSFGWRTSNLCLL